MSKLSLIVPYRNREKHLSLFIEYMPNFLARHNFDILLVEQFDDKFFNRAKLLNIGFEYKKESSDSFCFHDIDLLPIEADYSWPDKPHHLISNVSHLKDGILYPTYYGGVVIFNKADFIKINGYSNDFWGWGGEDDDLLRRVISHFGPYLYRRTGFYSSLPHKIPKHENYQNNIKKLSTPYDYSLDGLTSLKYEFISSKRLNSSTELIKVKI